MLIKIFCKIKGIYLMNSDEYHMIDLLLLFFCEI